MEIVMELQNHKTVKILLQLLRHEVLNQHLRLNLKVLQVVKPQQLLHSLSHRVGRVLHLNLKVMEPRSPRQHSRPLYREVKVKHLSNLHNSHKMAHSLNRDSSSLKETDSHRLNNRLKEETVQDREMVLQEQGLEEQVEVEELKFQ